MTSPTELPLASVRLRRAVLICEREIADEADIDLPELPGTLDARLLSDPDLVELAVATARVFARARPVYLSADAIDISTTKEWRLLGSELAALAALFAKRAH